MSKRTPIILAPVPCTTDDFNNAAPPDPRAEDAVPVARLEELRCRFDRAACDHPSVDAVVVYRPDLRSEEAERQARNLHFKPADPASENFAAEQAEHTRGTYAAIRCALDWDELIPPSGKSIQQLGGQVYWVRVIGADEYAAFCGPLTCSEGWRCTLFGPPARDVENTALHLYNMLAADAARLILPRSKAEGKALLSRWLIHLADRPEPIVPDSRWRYLQWPTFGGGLTSPIWVPVTPANRSTLWWAARLPNVFQLSRDAVEQAIDLAARARVRGPLPTAAAQAPAELPIIYYNGGKSYSLDGEHSVCVNQEQHAVLQRFLKEKRSMTAGELAEVVSNAPQTIARLRKASRGIFQNAIRTPDKKGEGYLIRVRTREN